jgi:hypothetical protein
MNSYAGELGIMKDDALPYRISLYGNIQDVPFWGNVLASGSSAKARIDHSHSHRMRAARR